MTKFLKILLIACLFSIQAIADTVFVSVNSNDWTEISTTASSAFITNSSVVEVRYVEASAKPASSITTGHLLHANDHIVYSVTPGTSIYVRTVSGAGSIAVSPNGTFTSGGGGTSDVQINGPLSSFGELSIAEPTPVTQIEAVYGVLAKTTAFGAAGGSTSSADGVFIADSGTSANGNASIATRRQASYRPGQGILARYTAIFDTPVVDNRQEAGLINSTDQLGFGYEDLDFGIIYRHGGESEIQELTLTTPAAGAETATVTVDGIAYSADITAGTLAHNAFEIATDLQSQPIPYTFTSNNDQVVASSGLEGNGLSFAFSSATAVGSWAQIQAGLAPTNDFIPQTDWNVNKFPNLNPQLGNVYQIQIQYLGFGGLEFSVEDPATAQFELANRIPFANTSITPSIGNPTFGVGWRSLNEGNTTSIQVKGSSAAAFVEGNIVRTEEPRGIEANSAALTPGNITNVISVRNRSVFGIKRNRVEVFGLNLTAFADTNKAAVVTITLDPDITGDLDFQYIDKATSVIEIATNPGIVSGGRLVSSFVVTSSGIVVDLEPLDVVILPGQVLTISANITSGAASPVSVSFVWQEDL